MIKKVTRIHIGREGTEGSCPQGLRRFHGSVSVGIIPRQIMQISQRAGRGSSDLRIRHLSADRADGKSVRQQQIVPAPEQGLRIQLQAGRVQAVSHPQADRALRLIDRDIVCNTTFEMCGDKSCIICKVLRSLTIHPSSLMIEGKRQIPVIKRDPGCYAAGQAAVHKAVVIGDSGGIEPREGRGRSPAAASSRLIHSFYSICSIYCPVRKNTRPAETEAVVPDAQTAHQVQILLCPMIGITGSIAAMSVESLSGYM